LFKCLSLVIEVPTLIVPPCQCFSTHWSKFNSH
jgi:hypothetical protein